MMDKETLEQIKTIITDNNAVLMSEMDKKIVDSNSAMLAKMEQEFTEIAGHFNKMYEQFDRIDKRFTKLEVFIENTVTDKISGLFDGYKSALENQALLQAANKTLAQEIDSIKMRLNKLEQSA